MTLSTHAPPRRALDVVLVNNMPDGAFVDTEQQFRTALAGAQAEVEVNLRLHTITGLSRSDAVAAEITGRYRPLDELWSTSADALIVTGTEPVEPRLEDEPYWSDLTRLLEWASESTATTLLSCLASHAALLMFDGIERVPLPQKCCGVYVGVLNREASLATDLSALVAVPHSRMNGTDDDALREAGYELVVGSGPDGHGWSVASRRQGRSTFVLCQGHLEYGTESLLREYRRDVRRYLLGGRTGSYPVIPGGYLPATALTALERFRTEVDADDGADPASLYERFPYDEVRAQLQNTWQRPSATLHRNWLRLAR